MANLTPQPSPPCPRCLELLKEQQELRTRIEELEKALAASTRSSKRQAAPFQRAKKKEHPKPSGRPAGHPGAKRDKPEHIDRTLEAPALETCPDCGERVEQLQREENYQTEIPAIRPEVTCFQFESGWCPSCQKRVYSRHPEQTSTATGAAAHHLGPRLRAYGAELKSRLGIPYGKIVELLKQSFGIKVSAGGLAHSNARLAKRSEPTLEAMKEALAQQQVVNADETGWRVAGQAAWLWVVCSELFTIYSITPNRCALVVAEILGPDFAGFLMRDGWRSYDTRLDVHMLRCLLHVMRNAQALEDAQSGEAAEEIALFILWIQGVFDLRQRAEQLSEAQYEQEARELLEWLEEYVQAEHASEANHRFAQRLAHMHKHLVPIVEQPELPATNNLAERQIRPAVVHRKSAAGNKTDAGAKTLAILASLAATCRQQGKHFAQVIQRILTAPAEQAVLFWQMPDPVPE